LKTNRQTVKLTQPPNWVLFVASRLVLSPSVPTTVTKGRNNGTETVDHERSESQKLNGTSIETNRTAVRMSVKHCLTDCSTQERELQIMTKKVSSNWLRETNALIPQHEEGKMCTSCFTQLQYRKYVI
jgi:hypothetical protein